MVKTNLAKTSDKIEIEPNKNSGKTVNQHTKPPKYD